MGQSGTTNKVSYYDVEIVSSARKHGISDDSIYLVLENYIYDELLQCDPNKTLLVGFDKSGRLIEVIVNAEDDSIVVFHAMKCRKIYEDRIGRRGYDG